jgi:hypothetical protein
MYIRLSNEPPTNHLGVSSHNATQYPPVSHHMRTGSPPKSIHHPQYPIRFIPPTSASPRTIFTILSSSTSSNTLELSTSHIFVAVLPMWPFVFCANDRRRVAMSVGAAECSWRNSMLESSAFSTLARHCVSDRSAKGWSIMTYPTAHRPLPPLSLPACNIATKNSALCVSSISSSANSISHRAPTSSFAKAACAGSGPWTRRILIAE